MGTVAVSGECYTCGYEYEGKNAMGVMVKHSKKYNHTVHVQQVICCKFVNGVKEY